jgi:hypothetical protein
VHAVVSDFEEHLGLPSPDGRAGSSGASGPRLVAFHGSTIGNMVPAQRASFLRRVRSQLRPEDSFLLGTDLVKDPAVLVAAYDDTAGVTAAFNKNVLAVMNAALGADFDLDAFDHVAAWNAGTEWIEMRLRSAAWQQVQVPGIGLTVHFGEGEQMRTEVSAKFRRSGVERELAAGGERAGLTVGQHVHRLVRVHAGQDGVVRPAAPDREVVNAEYPDPAGGRQRLGADEPDQHVTAGRHGKLRREPRPGTARQRERDLDQRLGQLRSAAGERRGQPRDLLRERGLRAPAVKALEPADVRDHQRPPAGKRKAGQLTLVAGVNPRRSPAASRALRAACPRPDPERHQVPAQLDAVYYGCRELRQKRINGLKCPPRTFWPASSHPPRMTRRPARIT